jgi:hypothetical protein
VFALVLERFRFAFKSKVPGSRPGFKYSHLNISRPQHFICILGLHSTPNLLVVPDLSKTGANAIFHEIEHKHIRFKNISMKNLQKIPFGNGQVQDSTPALPISSLGAETDRLDKWTHFLNDLLLKNQLLCFKMYFELLSIHLILKLCFKNISKIFTEK